MRRSMVLAGLLAGCSKGDDPEVVYVYVDGTTDDPEDYPTPTDTGGGNGGPEPIGEFSVGGQFGYDALTGTIVPVLMGGEVVPSYFFLELRSEEYNGVCDDEVCCYVYVYLDGYANEAFATDAGYLFGFHVPQTIAEGYSTCLDNGFDPADPAFGGGDPFEVWSDPSHGWGITLGGDPSSTVTEWTGTGDPYAQVIGGQFLSAELGSEDTLYFQAWPVDGTMEVLFDTQLDRASIADTYGALVTGFYDFDVMVHFDPIP